MVCGGGLLIKMTIWICINVWGRWREVLEGRGGRSRTGHPHWRKNTKCELQ